MKVESIITKQNAKLAVQFALGALNVMSIVFMLVYCIARAEGAVSNALGLIMFATLVLNMLYYAIAENRYGVFLIIAYFVLMFLNFAAGILATFAPFYSSVSIVGAIMMFLMPLLFLAFLLTDMLKLLPHSEKHPIFNGRVRFGLSVLVPLMLAVIAIFGYDALYNYNRSVPEYITSNSEYLFAFWAFALLMLFVRLFFVENKEGRLRDKLKKHAAIIMICICMSGFALSGFLRGTAQIASDIKKADKAFAELFPEVKTNEKLRNTKFSMPDIFFGIKTTGYKVTKDIVYLRVTEGEYAGLRLAYDVYYPTDPNAHRSVLVYMHGRRLDKGAYTYVARCRYFASLGYVVFDLQTGDYNEKNTNFPSGATANAHTMSANVAEFLSFASQNDTHGANWDSTFISGMSMGGTLTCELALSRSFNFEEYGINLRGIMPIFPGYWPQSEGTYNYFNYVDADSVPCIMFMGTHDGVVLTETLYTLQERYESAGNPNYIPVSISNAGHGCDFNFAGRPNQMMIYYMALFMEQLR